MPYTPKQRRAAQIALARKKAGKSSTAFKGMSVSALEDYASSPLEKSASGRKMSAKSQAKALRS